MKRTEQLHKCPHCGLFGSWVHTCENCGRDMSQKPIPKEERKIIPQPSFPDWRKSK